MTASHFVPPRQGSDRSLLQQYRRWGTIGMASRCQGFHEATVGAFGEGGKEAADGEMARRLGLDGPVRLNRDRRHRRWRHRPIVALHLRAGSAVSERSDNLPSPLAKQTPEPAKAGSRLHIYGRWEFHDVGYPSPRLVARPPPSSSTVAQICHRARPASPRLPLAMQSQRSAKPCTVLTERCK